MATQRFFEFSPRKLGKISHFDEHIFQMGWFNHQLEDQRSLSKKNVVFMENSKFLGLFDLHF